MRVGCGGCGGDAATLDGMTAAEIIAAAASGGGGVEVHSVTLTTMLQSVDLSDYAPSSGAGVAMLLVSQDATGYWVPSFENTGGAIVSPYDETTLAIPNYRPSSQCQMRLTYDGTGDVFVEVTPWDPAGITTQPYPPAGVRSGFQLLYHDEFDRQNAEWTKVAAAGASSAELYTQQSALVVQNTSGGGTDPWFYLAPVEFDPFSYTLLVLDVGVSLMGEFQGSPWVAAVLTDDPNSTPTAVTFAAAQVASSGDRLIPFRGNMTPPSTLASTASASALVTARGFTLQIAYAPGDTPLCAAAFGELGGGSTDYGLGTWTGVDDLQGFGVMFVNDSGDVTFRVEHVRVYGFSSAGTSK